MRTRCSWYALPPIKQPAPWDVALGQPPNEIWVGVQHHDMNVFHCMDRLQAGRIFEPDKLHLMSV